MQLTVRLPDEDMAKLASIAGRLGLKRSEVTRMAIKKFLAEYGNDDDLRPFDRVRHLLGIVESILSEGNLGYRRLGGPD